MNNSVTLSPVILLRKEVFFLEEWIEHHLSLGINSIYIYNNGLTSISDKNAYWKNIKKEELERRESLRTAPEKMVWGCKPNLDYFHDFSDDDILSKFNEVISKYPNVHEVPWVYGVDHNSGHPSCQVKMYWDMLQRPESWILNIDPDEYMVLRNYDSIQDFISDNNGFNYFEFYGKTYTQRIRNQSVRDIYSNCGLYLDGSQKWLINPPDRERIKRLEIHSAKFHGSKIKSFKDDEEIWFNHYKAECELEDFDDTIKKHIK